MSTSRDSLDLEPWAAAEAGLADRLRCPLCQTILSFALAQGGYTAGRCGACGTIYPRVAGIWRMLTGDQHDRLVPFLTSYQELRRREGWTRPPAYYLALPAVDSADPAAPIWRIRRRSFRHVRNLVGAGNGRWALDLGAGNGWLARHLARQGYQTVAADLNPDGVEGLEGATIYLDHDRRWFGRVQASMDCLPFADSAFALCTASAALHYADLQRTLAAVFRILEPGGLLIITDSPVYRDPGAGDAMAGEQRTRARICLGREPAPLPGGRGFLVEAEVLTALRAAGFEPQMHRIERPLAGLRRRLRQWRHPHRREEARFPVITGRKSGPANPA